MKYVLYIRRAGCILFCICLLCTLLIFSAGADSIRSYSVTLDHPTNTSAVNSPIVLNHQAYARDQKMTLAGWVKTDQQMSHYLYTLDGGKTWIRVDGVVPRNDVKSICPNTYQTAGFHFDVDLTGVLDGQYDLFVRGITMSGDEISVLAMLNLTLGNVDAESVVCREINLTRLGGDDALPLSAGQTVALGAHNLGSFKSIEVITNGDAMLTLSAKDTDAPNRFSFALTPAAPEDGMQKHTADLSKVTYAGDLLLTADKNTVVQSIRLYYNTPDYYEGELLIHMTATPFEYLGGMNQASAAVYADQTVGSYVRLQPTQDSNDPYVYFNIRSYLKENLDYSVSADHYRYAVITVQTPAENSSGDFRLFLCAGAIRGPSGNSHVAFRAKNDGQWHRYVIPLYVEDDWLGQIHGVRFDFIDSNTKSTDYANIASIGFYPDEKSAQKAAAAPFEVYHEQGIIPEDKFKEEGRAPSGRSDAITWFDQSLLSCFGGENKAAVDFDQYGHLLLRATESTNDPYVSFDMAKYTELTGTSMLNAQEYKTIVLRVLADKSIDGKGFVLYYYSGGFGYADGERSVTAMFEGDKWEYLVYDMEEEPYWTKQILGMRLDFATQIAAGQQVCISDILFFSDMNAWYAYAAQNDIELPEGNPIPTPPDRETEQITEAPTIEIPTQGPGLEYIPPEQTTPPATEQGCNGIIALPTVLVSLLTIIYVSFRHKKGEKL